MDKKKIILDKLIKEMNVAIDEEEVPVSAIVFDKDYNIISYSHNKRQGNNNVIGHAEVLAIQNAENKINDWRLDGYCMIVSLEPCDMCSIIIEESRINRVYYLVKQNDNKYDINIQKEEVDGYDNYKEEAKKLLTTFFDNIR